MLLLAFFGSLHARHAAAQSLATLYTQLLAPPVAQTTAVSDLQFQYDHVEFILRQGQMALTVPVAGHVTGAVYLGQGNLTFPLADAAEQAQWRLMSGSSKNALDFTAALVRFPDDAKFLHALGPTVHFTEAGREQQLDALLAERAGVIKDGSLSEPVRLLDAIRDGDPGAQSTLFYADLRRPSGDWVELDFDPLRAYPLRIHQRSVKTELLGNPDGAFGPTSSDQPQRGFAAMQAPSPAPPPPIVPTAFDNTWAQVSPVGWPVPTASWRLSAYDLNIARRGSRADVRVSVTAQPVRAGLAGILLALNSAFQIAPVTDAAGNALAWLQAPHSKALRVGGPFEGDWLYIALPTPLQKTAPLRLTIAYSYDTAFNYAPSRGDLEPAFSPPGWLYQELMTRAWYPMPLFGPALQPATFDVRLASSDHRDVEPAYSRFPGPVAAAAVLPGGGKTTSETVNLGAGHATELVLAASPAKYSHKARDEVRDALVYFSHQFGPYPYASLREYETDTDLILDPVSDLKLWRPAFVPSDVPVRQIVPGRITERLGLDTPSWPGLITVDQRWPIEAFCKPCNYVITPSAARQLAYVVVPHGVAHQWWGLQVGWDSDRDAWLPEALANGSALLFDRGEFGDAIADAILGDWQQQLAKPDTYHRVPNTLAPLAVGDALCTSLDPLGFNEVAYDKGGYVVVMLSAMMGPQAYSAFTHDLFSTFAGGNISTADFESMAARHMTPAMDLDGSHNLDWFFREYVNGTGAWTLHSTVHMVAESNGSIRVELHLDNPQNWEGLLPVYAMRDSAAGQRALIPVKGPVVNANFTVPFHPTSVLVDPHHEMLVQIIPGAGR